MGPEVLLVMSPGVSMDAYRPLIQALRTGGAEVTPVAFPCSGDVASLGAAVVRAADDRAVVVVAHGVGATLALTVHDELDVERWVLLGPVLDVVPGPGLTALAADPLAGPSRVEAWLGSGAESVVGCVSPELVTEVRGWIRDAHIPVDPAVVDERVWLGLGLLDEVATVEATLGPARRFPDVELVRFGIGRLDPKDYGHLDLIRDPTPIRPAVRAAVERP